MNFPISLCTFTRYYVARSQHMVSHTSHDRTFKNPLNKYRNGAAYDLKMVSNLNKYSLRDPFTGIASSALTTRKKK